MNLLWRMGIILFPPLNLNWLGQIWICLCFVLFLLQRKGASKQYIGVDFSLLESQTSYRYRFWISRLALHLPKKAGRTSLTEKPWFLAEVSFLQNFRPSLTYLEWLYFWVAERCILLLEKFSRLMVFKTVNYYLLLQEISRILTISLKNNRCFWVNWYCIAKYFLPLKGLTRANIAQR